MYHHSFGRLDPSRAGMNENVDDSKNVHRGLTRRGNYYKTQTDHFLPIQNIHLFLCVRLGCDNWTQRADVTIQPVP